VGCACTVWLAAAGVVYALWTGLHPPVICGLATVQLRNRPALVHELGLGYMVATYGRTGQAHRLSTELIARTVSGKKGQNSARRSRAR
jgi:purine-cytosine permease-like protein